MNTRSLAQTIAAKSKLSIADTRAVIDALLDNIAATARRGDEVSLPGFGKFKVRNTPARNARNPATGKTIKVAAARKVVFQPAKALKDSLNKKK
jgi:DNA-binding protein HU-beta